MIRIIGVVLAALAMMGSAALAQTPSTVRICNGTQPNCPLVGGSNPLPVSGTFSGSVSVGATAASALPGLSAGSQAFYESLSGGLYVQSIYGTTIVDLTHGLPVQPQTGATWTVTGAGGTFPVTQSTSPWVVSNGGTFAVQAAVTAASGSIASGAFSSGSVASGAFASGSIGSGAVASGAFASGAVSSGAFASGSLASGAMVDLVAEQTPITPATATATKGLLIGGQYNSTQATFSNGQQGALQFSSRGEAKTNIMDAAGNARGANVNASNQLSVSIDGANAVTQSTSPWVVGLNATPSVANGNGVVVVPASTSSTAFTITNATSVALEATRAAKASAGNVYGAYATAVAGGAAGFLVGYNATTCPADGAVTAALVLDVCVIDTTNKGCSISRPGPPRNYSAGICFYITTGASPFANKATGTDTGYISVDYN